MVIRTFFLLLLLTLGVMGAEPEKIRVSSFSSVLSEIAREVGGVRVEVSGHVRPGMDPHDYEPTPADLTTVGQAQLILLSAKHLEGYVGKLEQSTATRGAILQVGDQVETLPMVDESGKTIEDPHWWHSVACMMQATKTVRDALIRISSADRATFESNANAYLQRLEALAKWAKLEVAKLARDRRILVTSHDAFQYFAKENGFRLYPVEGLSSADQPSSKQVGEIIELIKAKRVRAIFAENIQNPKVLQEITRETGAVLGGVLYADGLGAEEEASSYEKMYRHNVQTIVRALK